MYCWAILHIGFWDVLFSFIIMFWDSPILICRAVVYSLHCLTNPKYASLSSYCLSLFIFIFPSFLVSVSLWLYTLSSTLPWGLLFDMCDIWFGIVSTAVPLLPFQDLLSSPHALLGWDIPRQPSSPCSSPQDLIFWIIFLSCI